MSVHRVHSMDRPHEVVEILMDWFQKIEEQDGRAISNVNWRHGVCMGEAENTGSAHSTHV